MAIDLVTVLENTSALQDEYIVHRLGLIPLQSSRVNDFVYAQDCMDCDDYCEKCSVTYELKVEADSSSGNVRKVTSRDLIISNDPQHQHCLSVQPVHDSGDEKRPGEQEDTSHGILIARLARGQRIDMTCIARKGIAKAHAKWSPVCSVSYRIVPPPVELELDRINAILPIEAKRELFEASHGLLQLDESTGFMDYEAPFRMGRIAVHSDIVTLVGKMASEAGAKSHEMVRYNPEPKRFDFVAETTGAMPPVEVLSRALGILLGKISDVQSVLR